MDKRSRCSGEWAVSDGNRGDLKDLFRRLAVRKGVSEVERGIREDTAVSEGEDCRHRDRDATNSIAQIARR